MRFYKKIPVRRRKIPLSEQATGELKPGEKKIMLKPGLWVYSKRKASVVIAEYEAQQRKILQKLNNTPSPEAKHAAYLKDKNRKLERKKRML